MPAFIHIPAWLALSALQVLEMGPQPNISDHLKIEPYQNGPLNYTCTHIHTHSLSLSIPSLFYYIHHSTT